MSALADKYRTHRAKGMKAKQAWDLAKYETALPVDYPFLANLGGYTDSVSGGVAGFHVTVSIESDDQARLGEDDASGWFTDSDDDGLCIKNMTNGYNGSEYKFYHPSKYTVEYAFAEYRQAGMSKSAAHEAYANRVQAEMVEDAWRRWYGVSVTVSYAGRKLADGSLWGIDTIPGYDVDPYLRETASDLIGEAIEAARDSIPAEIEAIGLQIETLKGEAEGLRTLQGAIPAAESDADGTTDSE